MRIVRTALCGPAATKVFSAMMLADRAAATENVDAQPSDGSRKAAKSDSGIAIELPTDQENNGQA